MDTFVRRDQEISGAALAGRLALESLIVDAKRRPRPFDRILVDDTSRLTRNVAEALTMVATLKFHGVGVSFVSQGIDTLDKSARQLVTINGMFDEQLLVGLADKVHRGQEGRVLKGLNPGGKLYGYTNVPILNPNRPGKYGRPAVDGVEQEINSEQAEGCPPGVRNVRRWPGARAYQQDSERGRGPVTTASSNQSITGVVPFIDSGDAAE